MPIAKNQENLTLLASGPGIMSGPGVFATYVHNLDPIALPIYKDVALRWYGLAYLLGFLGGFLLLRSLARRQLWVLKPEKTADFIAACALFGVFLGGRLGYILFYQIPARGWASLVEDPLLVLRVWEGGMASHGGILGLAIFTWVYARREKVSWSGLADGLCVVGPLGLFFGRVANFVNGELYGRVAPGVSWAMKFPQTLMDGNAPEFGRFAAAAAAATQAEPKLGAAYQALESASGADYPYVRAEFFDALLAANRHSPQVSEAIAPFLEPRHPSQLYAGMFEGLLLFGILYFVRVKFKQLPAGVITGLFFALYASFRICGEYFREPDAALVGIFSKGQFYSFFMFAFAAVFFIQAWRGAKNRGVIS